MPRRRREEEKKAEGNGGVESEFAFRLRPNNRRAPLPSLKLMKISGLVIFAPDALENGHDRVNGKNTSQRIEHQ